MNAWGKHLICDLYKCNYNSIRNANTIADFTHTLVKRIDMKAYGKPQIVHFGSGNKAGFTLLQLIETSNISAHFTEEDNNAYVDIFSCKDFKPSDVEEVIKEYFNPENIILRTLIRQAKPSALME